MMIFKIKLRRSFKNLNTGLGRSPVVKQDKSEPIKIVHQTKNGTTKNNHQILVTSDSNSWSVFLGLVQFVVIFDSDFSF